MTKRPPTGGPGGGGRGTERPGRKTKRQALPQELPPEAAMGRACLEQSAALVQIGNSMANGVFSVTRDPQMVKTVTAIRLHAISEKGGSHIDDEPGN